MAAHVADIDPEETASSRDRLVDAAIEIGGRQGLPAITYRAVAAQAGVTHGLVRHHFGSREQLVLAAFARAAGQDLIGVSLDASTVDEFASTLVSSLNSAWERPLLQFDETMQAIRGALPIDGVRRHYERYIDTVGRTLERVGAEESDASDAALVFAALDGIVLQHLIFGDDARTEALLGRLRRQVARGVAEG
jgi:AcrR family transcriptional regulator